MRARFTIVPTQGMAALPDSPRVKQTNSRPARPPALLSVEIFDS